MGSAGTGKTTFLTGGWTVPSSFDGHFARSLLDVAVQTQQLVQLSILDFDLGCNVIKGFSRHNPQRSRSLVNIVAVDSQVQPTVGAWQTDCVAIIGDPVFMQECLSLALAKRATKARKSGIASSSTVCVIMIVRISP